MYNAALGRFVGVDPVAEASESLSTFNYALNNPIIFNDPLGDKAALNAGTGEYAKFWEQVWQRSGSGEKVASYHNSGDGYWESTGDNMGFRAIRSDMLNPDGFYDYQFEISLRAVSINEARSNPDWLADRMKEGQKKAGLDGSMFYGARVYQNKMMEKGSAVTLPGIGIIINPQDVGNIDLLRHEFGHILQSKKMTKFGFYGIIAPKSLFSAIKQSYVKECYHRDYVTETTANSLSYEFFNQPSDWNFNKFPLSYPINPVLIAPNDVYNTLFNN